MLVGIIKFFAILVMLYVGLGFGFFACFLFMNYDIKITDNKTGEIRRPKGFERVFVCFIAGMLWIVGVMQSRGDE